MWIYAIPLVLASITTLVTYKSSGNISEIGIYDGYKFRSNYSKLQQLVWMITYFVFCALYIFRARVGTDWTVYENYYYSLNNLGEVLRLDFEPGYYFINRLFYSLRMPFQIIPVLLSSMACVIFIKSCHRLRLDRSVCFLLALFYMFYPTLEALRQTVPIFLFFFSLSLLTEKSEDNTKQKRKIWETIKEDANYFILNGIGILFHRSIGVLAIVFYGIRKSKVFLIATVVVMAMFGVLQSSIKQLMSQYLPGFYHRFIYYAVEQPSIQQQPSSSFKLLEYAIILIILIILQNKDENERNALCLVEIGTAIQLFLARFVGATYRLLYFTDIGVVLFYASLDRRFKRSEFRIVYRVLLIIYICVRLIRAFPTDNDAFIYHMLW